MQRAPFKLQPRGYLNNSSPLASPRRHCIYHLDKRIATDHTLNYYPPSEISIFNTRHGNSRDSNERRRLRGASGPISFLSNPCLQAAARVSSIPRKGIVDPQENSCVFSCFAWRGLYNLFVAPPHCILHLPFFLVRDNKRNVRLAAMTELSRNIDMS